MPDKKFLDAFPEQGGEQDKAEAVPKTPSGDTTEERNINRFLLLWDGLTRAGLGETVFRLGTHLFSVAMILIVVWGMRAFYLHAEEPQANVVSKAAFAAALPSPTPTESLPVLPPFDFEASIYESGVPRLAVLRTELPAQPRYEVTTYTVKEGDTVFGIAEKFNLDPETIMWGNLDILGDNPHRLSPGQELNILPVNGVYHKWSAGEGLNGVTSYYGVTPEDVINWPGNNLTLESVGDFTKPNIEPGTMLIIPEGKREFVSWSAPRIRRDNPAVAKVLGPGACGVIADGAVGIGTFIWPVNAPYLSGYDYSPSTNHRGIDLGGHLGDPLYASDNGVVVYAGWNDWGYGNVVVIDHGYGWQTLYAHLSFVGVACGQSVYQGDVIGSMGSTGNSSGPHLHFEMLHEEYGKVNPWDFLPPR